MSELKSGLPTVCTGVTFSAWDFFHAGHVIFLRQAKEQCDHLTVGLHTDPSIERPSKNKPLQSVWERHVQLSACRYIDLIIPYETEKDLEEILRTYSFNKRFLGSDYRDNDSYQHGRYLPVKGLTAPEIPGTEIVFLDRFHNYSSSGLRSRIQIVK